MSQAFAVLRGGAGLGQATGTVTREDVISELESRGYIEQVYHEPAVHHAAPTLTKHMAISVAVDEAISHPNINLPRTATHPYRCPTGSCPLASNVWGVIITWCVSAANGYLSGQYALPGWAQTALQQGTLSGLGLAGLGDITSWMRENPWFIQTVGDALSNYGEYLTSQDVKKAIEENAPKGALTKDDIPNLISLLQQGGYIPEGKTQEVVQGATEAASAMPGWMIPAVVGIGALLVFMMMRK